MARIAGASVDRAGLITRLACWYAKRRLGKIPDPVAISAHHAWIFRAVGAFELALDRARLIDARLKALAGIKAAALIGCPF